MGGSIFHGSRFLGFIVTSMKHSLDPPPFIHRFASLVGNCNQAPKCAWPCAPVRIDTHGRFSQRFLASGLTKAQTVEGEENQKDYYDTWMERVDGFLWNDYSLLQSLLQVVLARVLNGYLNTLPHRVFSEN